VLCESLQFDISPENCLSSHPSNLVPIYTLVLDMLAFYEVQNSFATESMNLDCGQVISSCVNKRTEIAPEVHPSSEGLP
jgi:hypothetical protein